MIDPEGLLTRVDQWHYLYAKGNDYFPDYGMDGCSMMKRTFLEKTQICYLFNNVDRINEEKD